MSFCRNNSQQITMNDAMYTITEREEKRLSQSWAKEFGDTIFPIINEERFAALYSSNPASRPNNPVNVYVGLLMLKEMFGQSDEDAIDSLIFDIRYQYALHTTSFEEQPVSKNSLSNLRSAIYEYNEKHDTDILQEEFKSHAKEFSKELQINGKMRRMDSLMVSASCKKMTRLELVYSCVSRLINKIEEIDERKVPKELKEYLGKGHHNEIIYRSRDIEVKDKLDKAMKDAIKLSVLLSDDEIAKTEEYQLLCRMIKDQTEEKEGEHELKPAKEIAPDSLQNPTDKDAVYRRKAGKDHIGYVGNVEEAFDGENSIITHYDLKPASYSDQSFSEDLIEAEQKQEESVYLLVDGAYYSDEIAKKAEEKNIKMIPTGLVGRMPRGDYSQFEIDEVEHVVNACPMGHAPIDSSFKRGIYCAHFSLEVCKKCPKHKECPVHFQTRDTRLKVSEVQLHTSVLRNRIGTKEYQKIACKRAGVEGMPSVLRRKYDVDHMPIRGLVRSKVWFGIKVAAINVKRYCKGKAKQRKDTLLPLIYRNIFGAMTFSKIYGCHCI